MGGQKIHGDNQKLTVGYTLGTQNIGNTKLGK